MAALGLRLGLALGLVGYVGLRLGLMSSLGLGFRVKVSDHVGELQSSIILK